MRLFWNGLALAGAAIAATSASAEARIADVRVGVVKHNTCIQNCDNSDKEDGPNIDMQVDFESPDFLSVLFSPQPYLNASVNVAGDTSFYGGGFTWRLPVGSKWAIEPGIGYVLHDGETELPYPSGTPEAAAFTEEHLLLGSRDLFRVSVGVTRDLPGPWAVEGLWVHFSHGQILGTGRNQGADQLGFRLRYSFGE